MPLTREQIAAKFGRLSGPTLGDGTAPAFERLWQIADAPDATVVLDTLRPSSAA
jgi:hypothetical protein